MQFNLNRPAIALLGGCLLAFLAAAVNVHFLISTGLSVSHLTGDVARLSADAAVGQALRRHELQSIALVLAGFLAGACASGFVIHHPAFTLARPYGRSIMAIGALCLGAWYADLAHWRLASFLAAAGCGLQNGLATHYRGLVLRTTHITGILTDLGGLAGMRLAGHRIEAWKLAWQGSVALAFGAGSGAGALLHVAAPDRVLLWLGLAYLGTGVTWTVAKRVLGLRGAHPAPGTVEVRTR